MIFTTGDIVGNVRALSEGEIMNYMCARLHPELSCVCRVAFAPAGGERRVIVPSLSFLLWGR